MGGWARGAGYLGVVIQGLERGHKEKFARESNKAQLDVSIATRQRDDAQGRLNTLTAAGTKSGPEYDQAINAVADANKAYDKSLKSLQTVYGADKGVFGHAMQVIGKLGKRGQPQAQPSQPPPPAGAAPATQPGQSQPMGNAPPATSGGYQPFGNAPQPGSPTLARGSAAAPASGPAAPPAQAAPQGNLYKSIAEAQGIIGTEKREAAQLQNQMTRDESNKLSAESKQALAKLNAEGAFGEAIDTFLKTGDLTAAINGLSQKAFIADPTHPQLRSLLEVEMRQWAKSINKAPVGNDDRISELLSSLRGEAGRAEMRPQALTKDQMEDIQSVGGNPQGGYQGLNDQQKAEFERLGQARAVLNQEAKKIGIRLGQERASAVRASASRQARGPKPTNPYRAAMKDMTSAINTTYGGQFGQAKPEARMAALQSSAEAIVKAANDGNAPSDMNAGESYYSYLENKANKWDTDVAAGRNPAGSGAPGGVSPDGQKYWESKQK